MADFSLFRLPASVATGIATFARFSGTTTAFVPVNTVVKTTDGSISFLVSADSGNPAWQPAVNAYSLVAGVMSIDLPIIACEPGLIGNVIPNTITLLASPVPGIDSIDNSASTSGGTNPESDTAFRSRFSNFFSSRSRATTDAIGYAISIVQPDLNYVIQENVDAAGNVRPGNMLIVVDDGSGALTDSLLNSLSLAISEVRAVGTTFSIRPPEIIYVQVSLSIECPSDSSVFDLQGNVLSAIAGYVNGRPIGSTLSITRISQVAYRAEPRIINISNITLNSGIADLVAQATASFRSQSVSFT
jgi:hypothetical protein